MSYASESMTVMDLLQDIDDYYLPAIQREFVWEASRIEALFDSLLRRYPIGTLLLWSVREEEMNNFSFYQLIRDYDERQPHNVVVKLGNRTKCFGILDGQQRITSLAIGLLGSLTEKLPRKRWNNPDAFPQKRLYMDLIHQPPVDEDEKRFNVRFLTEEQASKKDKHEWFLVHDILRLKSRDKLVEFRRCHPHKDHPTFEKNLEALHQAIHADRALSYFRTDEKNLDEVLEIFFRLNRGGVPLHYSDLLLSLATASWKAHDAREAIHKLVDQINSSYGRRFGFTKDFVLKALLVLAEKDVRFKTDNIRKRSQLEDIWDATKKAIKVAVHLVASFGFDEYTLTAPNAIIPIVYYLYKRSVGDEFLTHKKHESDRNAIRRWLLEVILGRVFSGQTDRILVLCRTAIRNSAAPELTAFPSDAIRHALRGVSRVSFDRETIATLIDQTGYTDVYAFVILSLLCPHLDLQHNVFHIDHIHPRALFTKKGLVASGMTDTEATEAISCCNGLPNLQLLPGAENSAKRAKPFGEWLAKEGKVGVQEYKTLHFIPDVDLGLGSFLRFYEARRQLLIDALARTLGVTDDIIKKADEEDDE